MSPDPPRLEQVTIPGPAGSLEAAAEEASGAPRSSYAVLCHPHPLHGGTMENKVVTTLGNALRSGGVATLRFNFRGVGRSMGAFDDGRGETDDARAVAAYGALRWPGRRLMLAGFSFGAFVALLITVAPPVDRFDFSGLAAPRAPWLVVQGDADDIVDPQRVLEWVRGFTPAPHLVVVPGVGHFFHGHLAELRDAVGNVLRSG
jgi:alpha/beta superfamily hydrolase